MYLTTQIESSVCATNDIEGIVTVDSKECKMLHKNDKNSNVLWTYFLCMSILLFNIRTGLIFSAKLFE